MPFMATDIKLIFKKLSAFCQRTNSMTVGKQLQTPVKQTECKKISSRSRLCLGSLQRFQNSLYQWRI